MLFRSHILSGGACVPIRRKYPGRYLSPRTIGNLSGRWSDIPVPGGYCSFALIGFAGIYWASIGIVNVCIFTIYYGMESGVCHSVRIFCAYVRQNQKNECKNKQIVLIKGGLCKRKRAEIVERTECTCFRKNGHNQSSFQNINVNL